MGSGRTLGFASIIVIHLCTDTHFLQRTLHYFASSYLGQANRRKISKHLIVWQWS